MHPDYPSRAGGRWFRNVALNEGVNYMTKDQCAGNLTAPRPFIQAECTVGIGSPAASAVASTAVAVLAGLLLLVA